LVKKQLSAGISGEQKKLMEEIKDITEPTPPPAPAGQPAKKPVVKKKPVTK
jgi:hypothetical protein